MQYDHKFPYSTDVFKMVTVFQNLLHNLSKIQNHMLKKDTSKLSLQYY